MIENTLHIGNHQYLMQLYTEDDFGINESISKYFVMIRNFNIVNNIVNDTHILIMERDVWLKLCQELENNKDQYLNGFDKVLETVFPIQTTELTGYSSLYSEFNTNFIRESLYKINNDGEFVYGNDVYPIYNNNGKETPIKCYKLRLYHPTTKSSLQSVITIDNHINGIHWYYLCNTLDKFPYKSETEIRKNNNIYSEYIEILFPNIDYLFGVQSSTGKKEIYNTYFDENLSTTVSIQNDNYINKIIVDEVERFYDLELDVTNEDEYYENIERIKEDTNEPDPYYFYVGEIDPYDPLSQRLNRRVGNKIKKFNCSNDLFDYIKYNSFPTSNDEESYKYVLIPYELKDNIIIKSVLNLSFSNNYSNNSSDLPIFEIKSDLIYENIKIIPYSNLTYNIYKTKPISRKIKFHDTRQKHTILKYFYIGPGKIVDSIFNQIFPNYENPISEVVNEQTHEISYTFDLINNEDKIIKFHDLSDLFKNSLEENDRFTYYYNEYQVSENVDKIYILFPESYKNEIIIADEQYLDNTNVIHELDYNIEYQHINISNIENVNDAKIEYMLISINNVAGKTFRIYNISYKYVKEDNTINIGSDVNGNDINVVSNNLNYEYSISNYIDLKHQFVPISLLLQPYTISENIDPILNDVKQVKLYLKNNKSIENNYIMTPFNVSLYPYSYIDTNTGQYIYDDSLSLSTTVYNIECKFELDATFGFNEESHKAAIVCKFNYPYKEKFLKNFENEENCSKLALQEAYKYYHNIDIDEYYYFWVNLFLENHDEETVQNYINEYNDLYYESSTESPKYILMYKHEYENFVINQDKYEQLSEKDKKLYKEIKIYNLYKDNENINDISDKEKLKRLIDINYDNISGELKDWEVEEEYQTNMDFFGFRIQIATDLNFQNIIYNQTYSINLDELDDFCFDLNNIFDSWLQMPSTLICKIMFIDHILNKAIIANNVIITKEYFKYLVNENNIFYIKKLNDYNDSMKEINIDSKTNKEEINDLLQQINTQIEQILPNENDVRRKHINNICSKIKETYQPFNFINNINCSLNKKSTDQTFVEQTNNYSPRVIYQPIYFRTESLQNIRIRDGVIQNIGVNLSKYMVKVESFKLIIDNLVFVETGRNDSFVIFNINSSSISNTSGIYNITNQDDQYISSGNWQKY